MLGDYGSIKLAPPASPASPTAGRAATSGAPGGPVLEIGVHGRPTAAKVCQVCGQLLEALGLTGYYLRYRICREHRNAPCIVIQGVNSRFCQQCGFFHPLQYFVGSRRSCQDRLDKHAVRRKRAAARKAGGLAAPAELPTGGGCAGGPPVAQLAHLPSPLHTPAKLSGLAAALQLVAQQHRAEQAAREGEQGSPAKRPRLAGQPSSSSGAATDTEVADGGAAGAGCGGSCSPQALRLAQAALAGVFAGLAPQSPTAVPLPAALPGSPPPKLGPPALSRVPHAAEPRSPAAQAGTQPSSPASPAAAAAAASMLLGTAAQVGGGTTVPPALLHLLALQLPQAPAPALLALAQSIAGGQHACPPATARTPPASPQAAAAAAVATTEAALRQHASQQALQPGQQSAPAATQPTPAGAPAAAEPAAQQQLPVLPPIRTQPAPPARAGHQPVQQAPHPPEQQQPTVVVQSRQQTMVVVHSSPQPQAVAQLPSQQAVHSPSSSAGGSAHSSPSASPNASARAGSAGGSARSGSPAAEQAGAPRGVLPPGGRLAGTARGLVPGGVSLPPVKVQRVVIHERPGWAMPSLRKRGLESAGSSGGEEAAEQQQQQPQEPQQQQQQEQPQEPQQPQQQEQPQEPPTKRQEQAAGEAPAAAPHGMATRRQRSPGALEAADDDPFAVLLAAAAAEEEAEARQLASGEPTPQRRLRRKSSQAAAKPAPRRQHSQPVPRQPPLQHAPQLALPLPMAAGLALPQLPLLPADLLGQAAFGQAQAAPQPPNVQNLLVRLLAQQAQQAQQAQHQAQHQAQQPAQQAAHPQQAAALLALLSPGAPTPPTAEQLLQFAAQAGSESTALLAAAASAVAPAAAAAAASVAAPAAAAAPAPTQVVQTLLSGVQSFGLPVSSLAPLLSGMQALGVSPATLAALLSSHQAARQQQLAEREWEAQQRLLAAVAQQQMLATLVRLAQQQSASEISAAAGGQPAAAPDAATASAPAPLGAMLALASLGSGPSPLLQLPACSAPPPTVRAQQPLRIVKSDSGKDSVQRAQQAQQAAEQLAQQTGIPLPAAAQIAAAIAAAAAAAEGQAAAVKAEAPDGAGLEPARRSWGGFPVTTGFS